MDLTYTDEAEAFRAEITAWLRENLPDGWFDEGFEMTDAERKTFNETWPTKLFEGGWICATWPAEYGGKGLTTMQGVVLAEEFANAKAPMRGDFFGDTLVGPTLLQWGSEEQKKEFLPGILSGTTRWCQGFSEPNSGSDLASLKTTAVLDGDEWVINGQKVWTTYAHMSDYGIVVARTDPEQPKHAGISMFIVDLQAPGVEVRPIHQIDGGRHFNEVFFTDVRVPADWLLGEQNNGWRQATAMLMYERVAIGSMGSGSISQPMFDTLARAATEAGRIDDPVVRDRLMRIYAMETTKSLVALRTRAELKAGKAPGPGGSLGKLATSMISRQFRDVALEIAGPASQAWPADQHHAGDLQQQVISSFSAGIAGGTDEIQRNIIGEKVLGLPREPSVDKDQPFRDLRRNG